jgi:folylpolyglutamate synthase/dihydrofolate synthase
MKTSVKQTASQSAVATGKQRNYQEIIEFLDAHWNTNLTDTTLSCMKQLDKAFGSVSQSLQTILVAGSNGKSLTVNFTAHLLQEEGLTVGCFYAPHVLTYNERITINNEQISNKLFTDLANQVINMAEALGVTPNSYEILTMMALLHFQQTKTDVAIFESQRSNAADATTICNPHVTAITRITTDDPSQMEEAIQRTLSIIKPGTHVISADQSKLNLQEMLTIAQEKGAHWAMPIRKLAQLPYPFEQLHGRCAALAERIAYIYINECLSQEVVTPASSLLMKQKGHRGRPTREAKRQSELNPKKTLEQFWKERYITLPYRFQIMEKEKPTILLDNAHNLDAFQNLLLGIRLLHYQRPLKGLTLIIGCNNPLLNLPEFFKLLRYFFKKASGQVIVCPVETIPGDTGSESWDIEKVTNDIRTMKIKVKSAKNFQDAFSAAQKTVDERNGLVVITGSHSLIANYWAYKGIKKL